MPTKPHPDLERKSALSDLDYQEAEGLPMAPEAEKAKVRREWMLVGAGLAALSLILLTAFALATRNSGDTTTVVTRTAAPARRRIMAVRSRNSGSSSTTSTRAPSSARRLLSDARFV